MVTNAATSETIATDRLGQIRRALNEKRPVNALQLARGYRDRTPEMENALAVCLLRNGTPQEAHRIYRGLLFPGGTSIMDTQAPAQYKANYVLSLLKSGRTKQALARLSELADSSDPCVRRLRSAVKRWKKSLPWTTRILLGLRIAFPKKVKLDVPVGEV